MPAMIASEDRIVKNPKAWYALSSCTDSSRAEKTEKANSLQKRIFLILLEVNRPRNDRQ